MGVKARGPTNINVSRAFCAHEFTEIRNFHGCVDSILMKKLYFEFVLEFWKKWIFCGCSLSGILMNFAFLRTNLTILNIFVRKSHIFAHEFSICVYI